MVNFYNIFRQRRKSRTFPKEIAINIVYGFCHEIGHIIFQGVYGGVVDAAHLVLPKLSDLCDQADFTTTHDNAKRCNKIGPGWEAVRDASPDDKDAFNKNQRSNTNPDGFWKQDSIEPEIAADIFSYLCLEYYLKSLGTSFSDKEKSQILSRFYVSMCGAPGEGVHFPANLRLQMIKANKYLWNLVKLTTQATRGR